MSKKEKSGKMIRTDDMKSRDKYDKYVTVLGKKTKYHKGYDKDPLYGKKEKW